MMGKESKEGSEDVGRGEDDIGGAAGHRYHLDRSKVRILLCDNNPKSSSEVFQLLCNCSYQVTSVKSARQVIDVLNCQEQEIDIILAEVDLPIMKGLKMLKYITKNKELRRIPIIMMSAQDEVSVVVKCLRLGASDYLVKPLRTNELLNLWTHMWRRRRMLGLPEKDVFSHDIDMALSDPSDANTNSVTLLSDDTDDKLNRVSNAEMTTSNNGEHESNPSLVEPVRNKSLADGSGTLNGDDSAGVMFSFPKKTLLKIGQSSAFFTYVKSSTTSNTQDISTNEVTTLTKSSQPENSSLVRSDTEMNKNRGAQENIGNNGNNIHSFPMPAEYPVPHPPSSNTQTQMRSEGQNDVSGVPPLFSLPFYYPSMMEQNQMPASGELLHRNLSDMQAHAASAMLPHYSVLPQCPPMSLMPSFPYHHPVGMNMQHGHVVAQHGWSPLACAPSRPAVKDDRTDRRAAALVKFRQKRKDRCFDKKIRYVNRKRLAEKRPRVRGQFVKQANNLDLNRDVFIGDDGEFDEDEDDEPTSRELMSSPEQDVSEY